MADQHPITASNQQSTPQLSQQKPRSFTEDFKTVWIVGGFVVLLIGTSSFPAFVAKLQSTHSSSLDIAGVATIFSFYFATFPLTTFATIAGLMIVRKWYKEGFNACCFLFFLLSVLLAVATWLGLQWHTFPAGVDPFRSFRGDWHGWVIELLPVYWQTYGGWTFFTCFVVGGFVAWAAGKMMWPYIVEQ